MIWSAFLDVLAEFELAQPSDEYGPDDDGQNQRRQHGIDGAKRDVPKHVQHADLIAQGV
jgi:hypothetical protein